METIAYFFDLFVHLDQHLNTFIQFFGVWVYLIIFLVIFCETGLVVTPILPGDSLLFALGSVAAMGILEVKLLIAVLIIAAVAGDTVNYAVGKFFGPRIFQQKSNRFFKREYLDKTHKFYEKHGGKTIFLARFIPIIRTFAPFVAGIGSMTYSRFIFYNISGGVSWIFLFIAAGYYFGTIPLVKHNFTLVILAIVVISMLPGIIEFFRQRSAT
ncbi:MAG: DedA family protein [Syntrophales bacterium LBB04]|nr:DedA family protein [Syntrophales bacterium LBB04]